ncbi:CHAD domain-containing protein [Glycomyces tenuis]|uniref:CHAD domain-containing protein n=1 Tax=Glycomyces tenuis TaxID=58116 RepID=UPI00041DB884|nr:CHAD domain-containing protein [Glycomyces tenuis]
MSTTAAAGDARTGPMTPSTPAGVVVRAYIGEQVDVLNRAIAQTQRYEPGSVGLTCATVHRVRTAVRGYRHLFIGTPHGGPQLDQLLAALKHTEDLEALRVHFADRFDQLDLTVAEYPRWYGTLQAEQEDSYRQIDRISTQAWVAALLGQVRVFAEHAEFTREGRKPAASLMGALTRAKTHLLDAYAGLRHAADLTVARDEVRQAARDARSMAEAVRPAMGRAADDVIAPVTGLEHLLEQYRLSAVARNWLLRLPGADRARRLNARLAELEQQRLHQLGDETDQAAAAMAERWR